MDAILLLAAKSFIIAGGALLLLQLARKRSAADRSLIAHLALAALVLVPVAAIALPSLDVVGPSFLVGEPQSAVESPAPATEPSEAPATDAQGAAGEPAATFPAESTFGAEIDWALWGYALPAALLLLLTLVALARLFVLKSRATVLVEPHWLTALAHAQQRMGFKHGTALLTSDELPSPISWGVVRPVILLNTEAAQSRDEAEAIITHELAHVARLDWAKLMIARVAVALFWFNPLVWLLSREAHQLREEAADDAVLAADIEDTDYAKLLVGVARHECRGLLIGAHGVAPGRNSLSRRIKRVLDTATARAPGGWRWSSAAGFFAAGMAVPVAALNFVPPTAAAASDAASGNSDSYYAHGTDVEAVEGLQAVTAAPGAVDVVEGAAGPSIVTSPNGETVLRNGAGGTITIAPADAQGRRKMIVSSPTGTVTTYANAEAVPGLAIAEAANNVAARAIDMKALNVTPKYAAAIRAAVPHLRISEDDLVDFKALGVTPAYVQEFSKAGFRFRSADEITDARAVGINPQYVRGIAAAGYSGLSVDELTEMRAVGVTPEYIRRLRSAGYGRLSVDKLVEMRAVGVGLAHGDSDPDG